MIARIRKSMDEKDQGFTLVELLIVMIIIGILAAIAIPVFLAQRSKARDTSTKADISTVGKNVATYFVEPTGTLAVTQTAVSLPIVLTDGLSPPLFTTSINVSNGTLLTGAKGLTLDTTWCVSATNASGLVKGYMYTSAGGLAPGTCP